MPRGVAEGVDIYLSKTAHINVFLKYALTVNQRSVALNVGKNWFSAVITVKINKSVVYVASEIGRKAVFNKNVIGIAYKQLFNIVVVKKIIADINLCSRDKLRAVGRKGV